MIKLLDFYATWCGPCKMLSPIIDELSEDRSLEVVKIDIDKNEDLVKEFGIMSAPTIVLLKPLSPIPHSGQTALDQRRP